MPPGLFLTGRMKPILSLVCLVVSGSMALAVPAAPAELKAKIISIERPRIEIIRKWSAIGSPAETLGLLMSQQIVMAALLKPCLRHPLIVEKTDDIGEQRSLGIDPLGVSLQIEPADAECSDPIRRFRVQSLGKLDP